MIFELLDVGKDNPRTGRELSSVLGLGIRDITEQIERERRDGAPICASTGANPGYYIAADAEELEQYCNRLKGRGIELFKTRQALIKVLKQINGQIKQEHLMGMIELLNSENMTKVPDDYEPENYQ